MRAALFIALKDLKLLSRDRFGCFWIFGFPLLFALFFGAVFGGSGRGEQTALPIALVDEARNEASAAFAERLVASGALSIERPEEGGPFRLHELETARALVRKGERVAYIRIRKGFGRSPFEVFSGEAGRILELGVDPTRSAESGYLRGMLMETVFRGLLEQMTDKREVRALIADLRADNRASDEEGGPNRMLELLLASLDGFVQQADFESWKREGGPDLDVVESVAVARGRGGQPRSAFDVVFSSAVLWGLVGCLAGFSIGVVRERVAGTLLRLRIAPISRVQLIGGKALSCFFACIVVAVFLLGFGVLFLDVQVTDPQLLGLAIVCNAFCFTGLMMVMAVLGKTEQAVAGAGWGVMMPLMMLGGGMVPLIAMPSWMLTASNLSPVKWGIYAIEGAVWRGLSVGELLPSLAILLGTGAISFAVGVFIFRRSEG